LNLMIAILSISLKGTLFLRRLIVYHLKIVDTCVTDYVSSYAS
jgi:hypothetical protein